MNKVWRRTLVIKARGWLQGQLSTVRKEMTRWDMTEGRDKFQSCKFLETRREFWGSITVCFPQFLIFSLGTYFKLVVKTGYWSRWTFDLVLLIPEISQ